MIESTSDIEPYSGEVKLQLWDTAGEEKFRSLASMYYKDAEAILLGFSLTNHQSFDNLDKWMIEIENHATKANFVKVIVGLKCDLED